MLHRRRLTRRTAQPHWGSELAMLSNKMVCFSPPLEALLSPHPLLKTSSDRHPMPRRRPCPSRQASVRQPSSGSSQGRSCARCTAKIRASSLQSRQGTGHSRDHRQTGQESVARSARPCDRIGRHVGGWASLAAAAERLHALLHGLPMVWVSMEAPKWVRGRCVPCM